MWDHQGQWPSVSGIWTPGWTPLVSFFVDAERGGRPSPSPQVQWEQLALQRCPMDPSPACRPGVAVVVSTGPQHPHRPVGGQAQTPGSSVPAARGAWTVLSGASPAAAL